MKIAGRLFHVRPPLARHDQRYRWNGDTKLSRQHRIVNALCRKVANLAYILLRQLWPTVIVGTVAASLAIHIAHVIRFRTRVEMIGIRAKPVVARVNYAFALPKRSIVQLVTEAMGVNNLPANAHHPVAITKCALPLPAIGERASIKILPEAVRWGWVARIARGMILHVNSPFATLTTPEDGSTHRSGNSIGFYPSILPHLNECFHVSRLTVEVSP